MIADGTFKPGVKEEATLRNRQAELLVCAAVRSWVWNVDVVTRSRLRKSIGVDTFGMKIDFFVCNAGTAKTTCCLKRTVTI